MNNDIKNQALNDFGDLAYEPLRYDINYCSKLQVDHYKKFLQSCVKDVETCVRKKSTVGLAKLLEKFKAQEVLECYSSDLSDEAFSDESDDVAKLKLELNKCKEDLLNDEKIFAEQQIDFEQIKNEMNVKISHYEEQIHSLNKQMEKLRIDCDVSDCQNTTLKKKSVKISRTKPCTMEEIEEIVRKKTFVIMEKNIKKGLEISTGKPRTSKNKAMLETFSVNKTPSKCSIKDHNNLEVQISDLNKTNDKLMIEIQHMKETNNTIHETKKVLEKNISNIRKQKSDLENRFLFVCLSLYLFVKL